MNFSIIIAVYQRKDELTELLSSLEKQADKDFEVIVVDDGSPVSLENIVIQFKSKLKISYFFKENSGPAKSRNFGMEKAAGDYFIFLDSDTIVPENYIKIVRNSLTKNYTDAYGGPDAAGKSFTPLQKAISFSLTSFLTTGGIRGGKKQVGKFQPRSFNMGISKKAFEKTGGFGNLRIGEDPDLSMTLWENGFETQLISEAFVYHKRRTSIKKFAHQVYQFGVARPILNQRHPKYKKITFWFPTVFSLGLIFAVILLFQMQHTKVWMYIPFLVYTIYFSLLFWYSLMKTNSMIAARMTPYIVIVQFAAYGYGFLKSWILLNIFRLKPEKAFPGHFSN
ncbi:MAG: glycosyltransferase [Flavobacteriia bacterium]|nr:glycosyltransferase [Flavobacteriia bacterium]